LYVVAGEHDHRDSGLSTELDRPWYLSPQRIIDAHHAEKGQILFGVISVHRQLSDLATGERKDALAPLGQLIGALTQFIAPESRQRYSCAVAQLVSGPRQDLQRPALNEHNEAAVIFVNRRHTPPRSFKRELPRDRGIVTHRVRVDPGLGAEHKK
jgi:hypothetical protein